MFVQDDFEVGRWLSVSAFFSPRVSALLRWRGWTSRLSAGEGFFVHTPLTEETQAAGLTRLIVEMPLFPQDAFMEGPMMAMDKEVNKPETDGLPPGWSGFVGGMMTLVRVLPPQQYDKIMDLKAKQRNQARENSAK